MTRVQNPVPQTESPYETSRRIDNLVRLGHIAQVRPDAPARCRVRSGGLLTNWLPFFSLRAGGPAGGRLWWPPVVGEQCVLLCPGGDLLQGVALAGLYSDGAPQGSNEPGTFVQDWSASDSMRWADGQLHIHCAKAITLGVGGRSLRITGQDIVASPDLHASGISLVQHVHGQVRSGVDATGRPQ